MIADYSQPLQQQMQHGKLSACIFADNDSSANQLSVPINRSTSSYNPICDLNLATYNPVVL